MSLRKLALLLPLAITGAAGGSGGPGETTVTVFAAASLAEAFTDLGHRLETAHPGTRIRFNFAGSQQLALQLEQGATADLFASADQRWMERVDSLGLLAGRARVFARNALVVALPRGDPGRVSDLATLARPGLKLVLAADAVPAGRYARAALRALDGRPGYPAGFADRVLANVVSEEENVRSVVAKVQLGEADAGIVYRSDVSGAAAPGLRAIPFPAEIGQVAAYPIAPLRSGRAPQAAEAFLELLFSSQGQALLARHGFVSVADHP
jgi:molybdate transport system substrate-binding protein